MQTVTADMRNHVTDRIEAYLRMQSHGFDPIIPPDDLILLMHDAAEQDSDATLDAMIDESLYLTTEYCSGHTLREYFVLRHHFKNDDSMETRLMLLRGLHHPEHNRDHFDVKDPLSVQRNIALLSAMNLLRSSAHDLLRQATANSSPFSSQREQGFSDETLTNLLLDYPQHWQVLITTMQERGYESGKEVFKEAMETNAPALNQGVL